MSRPLFCLPGRPAGRLCVLALAAMLSACSLAPTHKRPPLDPPAAFKESALFQSARLDADTVPDAWWTLFNDPVLNDLQRRAVDGNQNLLVSLAAMRVAQAAVGTAEASLLPTVGVSLGATRSNNTTTGTRSTSYALSGALASWELDLWGRLSNAVDAASARYVASVDDLLAARLSLQALLSQTYFSLRGAEAQGRAVDAAVAAYERSLALTRHRYAAGVASASDVATAESQLRSTQGQQLELRTQRAQLEHAIAVLVGAPPGGFQLANTGLLPTPPGVPALLPARLLERRPDIAAAERRVAAANAQIGVARAAFFPALALTSSAGYRSTEFRDLIQAPNLFWSIGPSLALGLLDGGARRAATDAAAASSEQAAATYRQTVLTAFQEVEDNLVAAANLQTERGLYAQALQAAQRALAISENQYKAGTVSYLSVVTAQATALTAERSLLDVQNRQLAALNQLLKNIAGRWDRPV